MVWVFGLGVIWRWARDAWGGAVFRGLHLVLVVDGVLAEKQALVVHHDRLAGLAGLPLFVVHDGDVEVERKRHEVAQHEPKRNEDHLRKEPCPHGPDQVEDVSCCPEQEEHGRYSLHRLEPPLFHQLRNHEDHPAREGNRPEDRRQPLPQRGRRVFKNGC